ncbi:MAG: PglL family O-oligosaccharyltransferase [Polaromonas sp.]
MFSLLVFVLVALPWLNPFTSGPTPAVWPLLFSWACAALLLGLWRSGDGRWRHAVASAWLAAGLISCVIALVQYFGAADVFKPWISQTQLGEAFGNLRQRNQFATLTSIALAALLWLAGRTGGAAPAAGRGAGPAWPTWAVLGAAGLLAVGNAASSSRTGLMQLGLLAALWLLWGGWRQPMVRRVLLTSLAVYALALLALPWLAGLDLSTQGMLARLRTGAPLCASRLTLWANVLDLIAQKPALGWGWGELAYAHYITLYDGPRFCEIMDNAHNLPLHLAVELGIGAALLLCGALLAWVLSQRPWGETDPARQLAWGVLAVIGLHSLLEYPLWYGPFQMAAALAVLLLWRTDDVLQPALDDDWPPPDNTPKSSSKKPFAQAVRALVAIVLIVIIGMAGYDYRRVGQIYLPPETRDASLREDTLAKIGDAWLYRNQLQFAALSLTPLTAGNAQWTFETASALLHYSPEPRVIEKVIESAVMLDNEPLALAHMARYRAAFAKEYALWAKGNAAVIAGAARQAASLPD